MFKIYYIYYFIYVFAAVKKFYTPTTPEDILLASDLLKFLIRNVENEEQLIFEFNIELIRSVITIWKDIIHIPSQLLIDQICNSENNSSKKSKSGLNILGIVLSNDLIPWTDSLLDQYINCLLRDIFEDNDPYIFKTASYVLGMSLSILEKNKNRDKVEHIVDQIKETLKVWNHHKDDKYKNNFRDILYGFSRSYPSILRDFRTIIQSKISSSTCIGKIKSIFMEMFLISLDFYEEENVYADITSIKLRTLLKSTDHQLLALHILNKCLSLMKRNEINNFMSDVELFGITSKNVDCRRLAYEFNMFIVTTYTEDTIQCQNNILKGFADPDINIRNRISEFWNNKLESYNDTSEKLEQLIGLGTDNCCGNDFLAFCIHIILNPAIKNNDAVKNLMTIPIDSESKLTEYLVNTNSKSRTSQSNLPYFARDVSLKQDSLHSNMQYFEFIRATGSRSEKMFTPTQDVTFLSKTTHTFMMQSQTSMLFNVPIHILDNRSKISESAIISIDEKFNKDDSLNYLRSRYVKKNNMELQMIDYSKITKFARVSFFVAFFLIHN